MFNGLNNNNNGRYKKPVPKRPSAKRSIRFADENQRRTSINQRRSSRLAILERTLVFDVPDDLSDSDDDNNNNDSDEDSLDQAALDFLGLAVASDRVGTDDGFVDFDDDASFDSFVYAKLDNCNHRGSLIAMEGQAIDFDALNSFSFNESDLIKRILVENMAAIQESDEIQQELQDELEEIKSQAVLDASAGENIIMNSEKSLEARRLEQEIEDVRKKHVATTHLNEILTRTLAAVAIQKIIRGGLVRHHLARVHSQLAKLTAKLQHHKSGKRAELQGIQNKYNPELEQLKEEYHTLMVLTEKLGKHQQEFLPEKEKLLAAIEQQKKQMEPLQLNIDILTNSNIECQATLDYIEKEVELQKRRNDKLQVQHDEMQEKAQRLESKVSELEIMMTAVNDAYNSDRQKIRRIRKCFAQLADRVKNHDTNDPFVVRLQRRSRIIERIKEISQGEMQESRASLLQDLKQQQPEPSVSMKQQQDTDDPPKQEPQQS